MCLISEPQSKGTHGVTGFCCVLISDVTVYEDQWVGETVLQSTFTSQLVNLGSYSHVRPEKCKIYFEYPAFRMLLIHDFLTLGWYKTGMNILWVLLFSGLMMLPEAESQGSQSAI